jgi:UDP-N-acetylmuramyl-tripeptide synthetase
MMYQIYSSTKQLIKKLLPNWLIKQGVNYFHWLETVVAIVINGWPSRSMRIVGITGTNGKTTAAIMTAGMLEHAGFDVGLNSTAQIGWLGDYRSNEFSMTTANPFQLHKLLRQMKRDGVGIVVMEVASHALVQHRVFGLNIEVAAITNLTPDHLDYHKTMDNYAAAKGKLFTGNPPHIVVNADDKWNEYYSSFPTHDLITYGTGVDSTLRLTKAKLGKTGTDITVAIDGKEIDTRVNMPGRFNVYNALTAMSISYALGLSHSEIAKSLAVIEPAPGRMEIIDEGQGFNVIVDYAHTADAVENVLDTVRQTLSGRLIAVIGGDGGRDPQRLAPFGLAAANRAEMVIVTDQEPHPDDPDELRQRVIEGAEGSDSAVVIKEIPDRQDAIAAAFEYAKPADAVVITGLGHQSTRYMNEGKINWDDREVARKQLKIIVNDPEG